LHQPILAGRAPPWGRRALAISAVAGSSV